VIHEQIATIHNSKDRLPSFANMVNIFMGSGGNAVSSKLKVGSPRSSLDVGSGVRAGIAGNHKKKSNNDIRIRKSSQMLKRNTTHGRGDVET